MKLFLSKKCFKWIILRNATESRTDCSDNECQMIHCRESSTIIVTITLCASLWLFRKDLDRETSEYFDVYSDYVYFYIDSVSAALKVYWLTKSSIKVLGYLIF